MTSLHAQITRLAQSNPELREHLTPLLKRASAKLNITVVDAPLHLGVSVGSKVTVEDVWDTSNPRSWTQLWKKKTGKVTKKDDKYVWFGDGTASRLGMVIASDGPKYKTATVNSAQMTAYVADVLTDMGLEVDPIAGNRLMVYLDCGAVTSLVVTLMNVGSTNVLGQSSALFMGPQVTEKQETLPGDDARATVESQTLKELAPILRFIKHFTSRCAIQQNAAG